MIEGIRKAIQQGDLSLAGRRIKNALQSGFNFGDHSIGFAHTLVLGTLWGEIEALLPPGTNGLKTSGWLHSLLMARPVNALGKPIPWFTYPAIDFLDTVLKPDWSILEWGSGNSTLWWSSRCRKVTAIEDYEPWYQEVKGQMPENVRLHLVPERDAYASARGREPEETFDVAVIDGSHRSQCVAVALRTLSPKGIVVFDNSDGEMHAAGQAELGAAGFYRLDFWGLIPSYLYKNCTSIYLRDPSMLQNLPPPHLHESSVGMSCQQAMDRNAKPAR